MSPQRSAILYFRDRLIAAGYQTVLGMEEPDLGHCPKNGDIQCELWLTDGQIKHWENAQLATDFSDTLECYLLRADKTEDEDGLWYDDIQAVYDALTDNPAETREQREYIWWDGETASIDRVAPLKRFDNGTSYSAGWKCARIDLPIKYLRGLSL